MGKQATIGDFEIVDHGIEHSQYFQGCGISWTDYTHVQTGIGSNFAEAYDDACEAIASADADLDMSREDWTAFDKRVLAWANRRTFPKRPAVTGKHSDEHYYHVSIRYTHAERCKRENRIVPVMGSVYCECPKCDPDNAEEDGERWDGLA